MSYRNLLRAAAILCFVHAVMHQIGMMQPPANDAESVLRASMQAYQTHVMGALRSYMDFHAGMGLFLTLMLAGFGAMLWRLSALASGHVAALRPLLLIIGLTFLAFAIASMRYFFIAPIVMEALIAGLAFLAYFKSRGVA